MQVQGQHQHQCPPSKQVACCTHGRSHTRSSGMSIMRVDSPRASALCNPSLSAASMSSWASQAQAFHQPVCQRLSTAPLERSTCPYHRSLLSFRMRSRSSFDLVVTMSCGLTLQISLIIALSFRCRRWRFGFVNGRWHGGLRSAHKSYTHGHVF